MSDIFISYAREDRETAQRLARTLKSQGWSVWWDTRLKVGEVWDEVIERELRAARCVIVLWSKTSVQSHWVQVEAGEGLERRILVPVRIENVQPPLAFRRVQAGDLIAWKGHSGHLGFKKLMADVTGIIGPPSSPLPSPDGNGEDSTSFPKGPWPRWLEHSVATIKHYFAVIAHWRPRKWHLAVAAGLALLVAVISVVYFFYEPQQQPPGPEAPSPPPNSEEPQPPLGPEESLPRTFETSTYGVIGEVTDFSMAGKSARLSIRIFFDDDDSVNDGSTRVLGRKGRQLCIRPAAATLVDERIGKEWKAASYSHDYDCETYYPEISQMYWMSFHIEQDLQTTFTLLIPGLARPVKGLEPR